MFEPVCVKCGKSMGFIDVGELEALEDCSRASGCLCFDCEPLGAMSKPEIFWNMLEGDRFTIGDTVLVREEHFLVDASRTHERTHERTRTRYLSSYTYLNRNDKKSFDLWDLTESTECPECHGQSFFVGAYGGKSCATCADFGSISVWPEWIKQIVWGERENG